MRPKGTREQLAARRLRGLKLVEQGESVTSVARTVGVSRQAVYDWKKAVRQAKRAKRSPGGVCRLSQRQLQKLARELSKGAFAQGYANEYWTLERIARVIYDVFEVRYTPSEVWHLMRRMNWSSQRLQRVALERDDGAVVRWQRYTCRARQRRDVWPQIKKVARRCLFSMKAAFRLFHRASARGPRAGRRRVSARV